MDGFKFKNTALQRKRMLAYGESRMLDSLQWRVGLPFSHRDNKWQPLNRYENPGTSDKCVNKKGWT